MKKGIIAIVGLGYVGLPLALAFGQKERTIGFDLDTEKIDKYRNFIDPAGEIDKEDFSQAGYLELTTNPELIRLADFIIVTVPTPIDEAKMPDLEPLKKASATVGAHMKKGSTVVYESTVYPGLTEEICIPILEANSGLAWKKDFHVGYSPERINPGDKEHRLQTVVKVVAGDDDDTLEAVARLYELIVDAGVHRASGIKVAEAAKVIENTQRDLNIALMNELAMIFDRLGIDTTEVLEAAGTKWNFLRFKPGLVGGHCIGVDPYYLTRKAQMLGYHPEVILSGRRVNDSMGKFIAEQTIKRLQNDGHAGKKARVAVLGLTFKENCRDIRNTRVIDIISELRSYGVHVLVHEPVAEPQEVKKEYGIALSPWEALRDLDAVIFAVAHQIYLHLGPEEIAAMLNKGGLVVDVKAILNHRELRGRGLKVWRL